MENKKEKTVVVTGDLTVEWNLALFPPGESVRSVSSCWKDTSTRLYQQYGGAALLTDLVAQVASSLGGNNEVNWEVRSIQLPKKFVFPNDEGFHHSHAVWTLFNGKEPAWRVKEFLGLSQGKFKQPLEGQMVENDPSKADLVILEDADLGFRDRPEMWPEAIKEEDYPAWILVKMARPVAQGELWDHLHKNCAQRVIVVMNADDLRRTEVQISRELSWERTAHDLYWELTHNPRVNSLSRCAHVIVSFDTAGAFLLSRADSGGEKTSYAIDSFESTLFFDPFLVEGMWNKAFPGGMIGYNSCLTAGIARQLMLNSSRPSIYGGIQSGLAAVRLLHQKGYTQPEMKGEKGLNFPLGLIGEKLAHEEKPFKTASVPSPVRFLTGEEFKEEKSELEGGWSILQDLYSEYLEQVANRIVLEGVEEALGSVPLGQFGKFITADRREVESFRSIRSLICEYCGQSLNKPLSIAVFGPPGSGKSFAVKQIADSVQTDKIKTLEFNLSQFNSLGDLYDAFHQVRDAGLSGKIPLVFWDEFDTTYENKSLGWLRYFLAPMQDGTFQEGQVLHPIGRCIFVFAGGTCCRMEKFTTLLEEKEFMEMKGPDFLSRLKGYINILGPNPYTTEDGAADPYYLIRRAIVIRLILNLNVPQIFSREDGIEKLNIDRGVLRALLHIRDYKHGIRSLESIIYMSSLSGKTSFERSSLPPENQLNLHVNGDEFLALAQQLELEGDLLETLAEAAHDIYCEDKLCDGLKKGPQEEIKKVHPLLKPYADLEETDKEANRIIVRNIPTKLAVAGYIMVPARSEQVSFDFPGDDLEKLAKLEHDLWVKARLEQGFTLGEPTEDNPRRNPHLVEWDQLPENIKEIDRNLIRGIQKILARAGYAVVKLKKEK